jgi:hypothetical protein
MSPLKQTKGTTLQRIRHLGLIAAMVTISLTLISPFEWKNDVFANPICESARAGPIFLVNAPALAQLLHMPRVRGKTRRGAAWYAYDSRRKRQKAFERALALASVRATRATRDHRRHETPPMVYVEEYGSGRIHPELSGTPNFHRPGQLESPHGFWKQD